MAEGKIISEAARIYRKLDPDCNTVVPYATYSPKYFLIVRGPIENLRDYGGIWKFAEITGFCPDVLKLLVDREKLLEVMLYVKLLDLTFMSRLALTQQ